LAQENLNLKKSNYSPIIKYFIIKKKININIFSYPVIEKTKNLTTDYETLKNELKIKEGELQSSINNYKELSRLKLQEENIQQSSMDKIIATDKKVKSL
jgi:hypothetical protein